MTTKRVLVVHYFFPPLGGGGVPRVLKFVKYLPELGWDVTVLTSPMSARSYEVRDESRLSEVPPNVHVVRAAELSAARMRQRMRNPLLRLRVPNAEHFIGWPDEIAGWLPGAITRGTRVARDWQPSVVFSSSFPYTSHLAALGIARAARVPWVADFRDEWTLNPQGAQLPWPLPSLNARTERALVRRADRVVVVDDYLPLAGLRRDDPRRIVIHNGVDEADFASDPSSVGPPTDVFRLAYVGSLYGTRDLVPVLTAISRLIASGAIDVRCFELTLVGNVWIPAGVLDGLPFAVNRVGYVEHERAVLEMHSATALLFYAPMETRAGSGKIFEYLLAGRPVLAVARPDNLAHRLVAELGAGAVASPDDPIAIEGALTGLYQQWTQGVLSVPSEVRHATLQRFSRRGLTQKLADVFAAVARSQE